MANTARKMRRMLLLAKVQEIEGKYGSINADGVTEEMLNQSFDELRSKTEPDDQSKPHNAKPSHLKIIALARRGMTAKQISDELNADYGVVWKQMRKAGFDTSKPFLYRDNYGRYFKSVTEVTKFYRVSVARVINNQINGVVLERGQWAAGKGEQSDEEEIK